MDHKRSPPPRYSPARATTAIIHPGFSTKRITIEQAGTRQMILVEAKAKVTIKTRGTIVETTEESSEQQQQGINGVPDADNVLRRTEKAWSNLLGRLRDLDLFDDAAVDEFWTSFKRHKEDGHGTQRLGHPNSLCYLALCQDRYSRRWAGPPLHDLSMTPFRRLGFRAGNAPSQRIRVLNLGLLAIVHDVNEPSASDGLTPWVVCLTSHHHLWLYLTEFRDEIAPRASRVFIPSAIPTPPYKMHSNWDEKDWTFYKELKGWIVDCGQAVYLDIGQLHIEHVSGRPSPGWLTFPDLN